MGKPLELPKFVSVRRKCGHYSTEWYIDPAEYHYYMKGMPHFDCIGCWLKKECEYRRQQADGKNS